jgi:hypothetical protein
LPVRSGGIDDPPQLAAQLCDDVRAAWIAGPVDPFIWIRCEIE